MRVNAPRINPDFTAEHAGRIRPELATVPPCRACGVVPVGGYARYDDGSVSCVDRASCYRNRPE